MIRFFANSVLLVALVLPLMTGCDNPACALAGNCSSGGGSGGFGSEAASVPVDGEELTAAPPTIVKFAPSGTAVDTKSPIVLTFSESMSGMNLSSAFELAAGGLGLGAVPLATGVLIGDGHMVVFPIVELMPETEYTILHRAGVVFADRTGQALVQGTDREIGTFTTAAAAPTAPTVIATWPENLSTNESPTGEIVVVFSRPMDAATVVDASWVVTVGGTAPTNDPSPQPLSLTPALTDTRVFRWRSTDASTPLSLGLNADVRLELSPTGQIIEDADGVALPNRVITYKTIPFSAPTGGAITLGPVDAIGIDQLSGPQEFAVRVDLVGAQAGDRVGVYMFGRSPQQTPPILVENLPTIALLREEPIVAPFTSFTFTAAELDLVRDSSPLQSRFTDGTIAFAFYLKRGGIVSTVKLLDVDSTQRGVQSPIQDLVPPILLGLSTSGTTVSSFRSDQRGIVIVGRASEEVRAVSVVTSLGNNEITMGQAASVTGSTADGLFIAAPVKVGVLTPAQSPQSYTIEVFDRALNGTGTITGQFTQVGQAANGVAAPFMNVTVEVIHAKTLAPIEGATVYVHERVAGVVSSVSNGTTPANGRVTLPASMSGSTIVTVVARTLALDFDVVTFDGVPTDSVSIPLTPSLLGGASLTGSIVTTDPLFAAYTKSVADTRFPTPGETLITAASCSPSTQLQALQCNFGSTTTTIRAQEIGAVSTVVAAEPINPLFFSALTFLKGFQLALPVKPVEPAGTSTVVLSTGTSLDSPTLDPEERPIDVTPLLLTTTAYPMLSGTPRVRVEATSPGIGHAVTVGRGIGFNDMLPANTYAIRAAYPGSVDGVQDVMTDQLGRYVRSGTFDADLLVRAEVVDTNGNRGGVRPRLSAATGTYAAPAPPTSQSLPFASNGPVAVDFTFTDTLLDTAGQTGIHKIVFTDAAMTNWTVWRLDEADVDGPLTVANLPKVGIVPALPLAPGAWSIRVSSFAFPTSAGLNAQNFLWSDVEREFARFAHAAVTTATPP